MILLFIIDYGNTMYIYDISLVSPMSNFTQSVMSNTILIIVLILRKKTKFHFKNKLLHSKNKLLYTKQITTKTRHYFSLVYINISNQDD